MTNDKSISAKAWAQAEVLQGCKLKGQRASV